VTLAWVLVHKTVKTDDAGELGSHSHGAAAPDLFPVVGWPVFSSR